MNTTNIDRLTLQNYRAFKSLEIDFHPKLTVLVARNGMGKTAVLDALAAALFPFVEAMQGRAGLLGPTAADVRMSKGSEGQMVYQVPMEVQVTGRLAGIDTSWSRSRRHTSGRADRREAKREVEPVKLVSAELLNQLRRHADGQRSTAPVLPVLAYYGSRRFWGEDYWGNSDKSIKEHLLDPTSGYASCLKANSGYVSFGRWFKSVSYEATRLQALPANTSKSSLAQDMLVAVQVATDLVLKEVGWHRVQWDYLAQTVVASHPEHGELPVTNLSDGTRHILGLVSDLAHRCVRLNPHLGKSAPIETPGIVLIDEVDMFLHPEWQQVIVRQLRTAFPAVQFIISTHSPQVISTVAAESIRLLGADGRVRGPTMQTLGVESNALLAEVMGVNPIPSVPEARWVADYQTLVDQSAEDGPEAGELWQRILDHFGAHHPVVLECERLLRWQRIKRRRSESVS